ncbi:MAG TPA: SurA N-terminal domain-containing protein [Patescibacteria group bacterium]|nr:SurA N-terminal domain-containing protein [Patescibacteria group bacterium]
MPRKTAIQSKPSGSSAKKLSVVTKENDTITIAMQQNVLTNYLPIIQKKLKNPKVLIGLAVILAIVATLYALKGWFIVAMVNGKPITRYTLDQRLEQQSGKQVLNGMITQMLIEQYASGKHVTVSQSEIDSTVNQLNKSLAAQGQTLDSALTAQGMTKSEFLEQVRLQKLVQKILGSSVTVSDKEVSDYIAQHKSSFDPSMKPQDIKNQVRSQLQQQKLSNQAQALVTRLQSQAKISYFVNL